MKAAANEFDIIAARVSQRLSTIAVDSTRGRRYWQAAERDEQSGFPLTAAMEWQRAAECFGSTPPLSNRCWRQWERIVHLPRQLAKLIGESETVVLHSAEAPESRPVAEEPGCLVAVAA